MSDLRDYTVGQTVQLTLESGEEFEGMIVEREYSKFTSYSKGWIKLSIEGDWWEQVNDRVDNEVLTLRQEFTRSLGNPKKILLTGVKWVGPDPEASEPEYHTLGKVAKLSKN